MAAPLPTPGQLVLENIALLSSSPTAFQEQYGVVLTPTTFSKPGNSLHAHAALHFLLSHIEPHLADPLFKPSFPVHDREQERRFRRLVESRLSTLEKSKLLPVGLTRKNVINSAGGDRFLDLLWNLSSLALQQACLRQPPYGPLSRLRINSAASRPDSLSHQSSIRSNRSLLSIVTARSERPVSEQQLSRQRRFLGVGILSAAQQSSKDPEHLRARIDAERHALQRTSDTAKRGETRWASEAESLREKINHFEVKLARLKGQLSDMGFDENGVDIRSKNDAPQSPPSANASPESAISSSESLLHHATASTSPYIPTSPSGDSIGDDLKTSPIDSAESGSSIDDPHDSTDGVADIAADLSRLLSFKNETRQTRESVDQSLCNEKPNFNVINSTRESMSRVSEAADIVDLVRAAAWELEEATNRMDEIREVQKRVGGKTLLPENSSSDIDMKESGIENGGIEAMGEAAGKEMPSLPTGSDLAVSKESVLYSQSESPTVVVKNSTPSTKVEIVGHIDCVRNISQTVPLDSSMSETEEQSSKDNTSGFIQTQLSKNVTTLSSSQHQGVIDSSKMLQNEVRDFSERVQSSLSAIVPKTCASALRSRTSESGDEKCLDAAASKVRPLKENAASSVQLKVPPENNSNAIQVAAKALFNPTQGDKNPRSPAVLLKHRNNRHAGQSLDTFCLRSGRTIDLCPRYDTDVVVNINIAKNSRSVRFAELPPSYSQSRSAGMPAGAVIDRLTRCATEVHPRSPLSASTKIINSSSSVCNGDVELNNCAVDGEDVQMTEKRGVQYAKAGCKLDSDALIGASGQKPPKSQRHSNCQRVVHQKEVLQRSVVPVGRTSSLRSARSPNILRSNSTDVTRSWDGEAREVAQTSMFQTSRNICQNALGQTSAETEADSETVNSQEKVQILKSCSNTVAVCTSDVKDNLDKVGCDSVPAVKEQLLVLSNKSMLKNECVKSTSTEGVTTLVKSNDLTYSISPKETVDTVLDEMAPSIEATTVVEKDVLSSRDVRLDSSNNLKYGSSSNVWNTGLKGAGNRSSGKVFSKRSGLLRISSGSLLGSFSGRGSSSGSSRSIPDASEASQSLSVTNMDSIRNSVTRLSNARGRGATRCSGGFFAGETAQWQENVRQQTTSGTSSPIGSPRMSEDCRAMHGSGRPSTASNNGNDRKSRVQSFRARLAVFKRE